MYVQVYPEPAWCLSTMFLKQDLKYIYIYILVFSVLTEVKKEMSESQKM